MAQEYEDHFFKRGEIDEMMEQKMDFSEIKFYPGSPKGPLPQDDPQAYSKWFIEN